MVAVLTWTAGASALAEPSHSSVRLILRWDHQFQFAGFYEALWQGHYADAGLDVEIVSAIDNDGKRLDPIVEVLAGRADFGLSGSDLLVAIDNGADLAILPTILQRSAVRIFARADDGIATPADLANRRVWREPGDLADVELLAVLDEVGVPETAVSAVGSGTLEPRPFAHLMAGRIDAYAGYLLTARPRAAASGIELVEIDPASYDVEFMGDALFTTAGKVSADPSVVERFVAASLAGWRDALSKPEETVERIATRLPRHYAVGDLRAFNREQAEHMRALTLYPTIDVGTTSAERWAVVHEVLADHSLVSQPFDGDRVYPPARLDRLTIEGRVNALVIFALTVIAVLAVLLVLYRRTLSGMIAMRLEMSRLEAAHSADQSRKNLATAVLGQGYWEYWPETRTIRGDAAFFALIGQDPAVASDMDGLNLDAVVASAMIADPEDLETYLHETLADDAPGHFDLRLSEPSLPCGADVDGHVVSDETRCRWIGLSARRTPCSDLPCRHSLIGMATDISALRTAQHAAATYKNRLLDIAENIPGAVFEYVLYPDGRDALTYVSTGCERLWGVSREQLLEDASVVWRRIDPEDAAAMQVSVAESAANLTQWTAEARYRMPDGRIRRLRSYGQPRRREDGAVVWQSVMLDETAYQEMQAELSRNRAMVEHSKRLETVGQMTSGIAHDFNNLLAVIHGSLELVIRAPERSDRETLISDALGAAERGATLVDQLLTFGRQSTLNPVICDLNETVGRTVELLRRTLPAEISVAFTKCLESPLVEIDEMMLENALLNIALNARDAMPNGGSILFALTKQPESASEAERIELAVTDTGAGMSEDVISHAFDPFFTTKSPGAGTGMGLSMVHGFVEQSGGSVRLRSAPNDGTTITLSLPSRRDLSASEARRPTMDTAECRAPALRPRILVVDDMASVREVLERQLATLGYRTCLASGTSEALDVLASQPDIGLMITDMRMPGRLQGPELVGVANEIRSDLPIILISGDPIVAAGPDIRATRHVTLRKPVGLAALNEALGALLCEKDAASNVQELETSNA